MKFQRIMALLLLGLSFEAFTKTTSSYFSPLDVKSLHDIELENEKKGDEPPKFAVPHAVSISPEWERTSDGYVWTHEVEAPNAVSLNFGFNSFYLPEGAELNIYSHDRTQFIRSFTAEDNNIHRALWTPVILTDHAVIEVTVPFNAIDEVQIELTHVGQGFRQFGQSTLKAGSCNIDVACSDSKGWEDEINSVGVISTGGSTFCTGFMVNNTSNDRTPFFMTADHCRITPRNAASLVVYWNYQTSKCKGPRDGSKSDFQTGSVHLASSKRSDFALLKLLTQPRPEWNVRYAGWDATGSFGTPAVAIHHPNTDEKSISFENDPTVISSYGRNDSPGDGTHVQVIDWDKGTTEPGSSGSPLFDTNHRVIGQLHGGRAACGNDLPDWYGRFSVSWRGDGRKTGSLRFHLDQANTGRLTTDTL